MKPSESLYWIRASLGIIIGALTAMYYHAMDLSREKSINIQIFLVGLSLAIIFYIITYYALRLYYFDKFKKKSKVMSTGIGIYFLLWIVVLVFVNTVL